MASDLIWTTHLEHRLAQRGVSKNEAFEAIRHPDQSLRLSADKCKLIKSYSHKKITLIAVYKQGQWVILTAWSKGGAPHSPSTYREPLIARLLRSLLVQFARRVQYFLFKR